MRRVICPVSLALLVLGIAVSAGAAPTARQCRQTCQRLISACADVTSKLGFGSLEQACRQTTLKRCKRQGLPACGTFCGDDKVVSGEACDGMNLNGKMCQSLGFASGTLTCSAACTFNTSGCTPFPPPLQPPTTTTTLPPSLDLSGTWTFSGHRVVDTCGGEPTVSLTLEVRQMGSVLRASLLGGSPLDLDGHIEGGGSGWWIDSGIICEGFIGCCRNNRLTVLELSDPAAATYSRVSVCSPSQQCGFTYEGTMAR